MANFEFEVDGDLSRKLVNLGNPQYMDATYRKALISAGSILYAEAYKNLKNVIGKNPSTMRDKKNGSRSTGELLASLGVSPVRRLTNGNINVKIGFREPRKNKTSSKDQSNERIANVLENGRHGSIPRPFMQPAIRKKRKEIIETISKIIQEAVDKA